MFSGDAALFVLSAISPDLVNLNGDEPGSEVAIWVVTQNPPLIETAAHGHTE